ncbi:MAG TPA: diguanylate cyclase [Terriglobia bacterium]|nr:diguanylate cyclase [Terriglobia bacterium]
MAIGGRLPVLAITVILILSAAIAVLLYSQLLQFQWAKTILGGPQGLLRGFGFLMLLTVIYLLREHMMTARHQQRLLETVLEEEALARALQRNPLTDYHHPEVCRDILVQQASHSARLRAPLSLLEVSISGFARREQQETTRPSGEELVRQLKCLTRATDSVLRWTADSFLMVFPEVTREELAAIKERLRQDLEQWMEEHLEPSQRPALRWRGATSTSLGSGGDILLETQQLLEREGRLASRLPESSHGLAQRDKGIALALELELSGEDRNRKFFERKVVTERVASDRFWCVLEEDIVEMTPLTVTSADGAFCEQAILIQWLPSEEGRLAEMQFPHVPDRWVIRREA